MRRVHPDLGLLAGLLLVGIALRPQLGGVGPLVPRIQGDLGVSHAVAGLLGTIPLLCMGLFAPKAAAVAARFGTARAIGAALGLVALFGALRTVVPDSWEVLVLTVPIGIGIAVAGTLLPLAVRELLPQRTGVGTGVYGAGMNVGSGLAPALAVPLAAWLGGWRESLAVMAGVGALLAVAWLALARGRGGRARSLSRPAPMPLRSGTAWICCGIFGLLGISFYGIAAWLPDSLREHGWSDANAGYVLALTMAASAPVVLAVPSLAERFGSRRSWMFAGAVLQVVAVALFIAFPAGGWGWSVVLGAALGTEFATLMTLPLDLGTAPARVAAAAGMMLGVGYTISAIGPFALGAVRDLTGSYTTSLWLIAGAAALVALAGSPLTRERLARAAAAAAEPD
jgi:CP family cyanate transporter-like MFS transporter